MINIQRCPHDKEHPFAIVSRELIRDKNLSPECRWLLIYLLSNKDGWNIRVDQIYKDNQKHMGIRKIYKLINEAMLAGYMTRVNKMQGNLIRGVTYYLSETPKFSNNFSDVADFDVPKSAEHKGDYIPDSHESPYLEEPPPLTPLPITPIKEKIKEDWWRSYFSKVASRELFDAAWEEYLDQPFGSVKHLKGWLIAVIQRKLTEGVLEEEGQERIARHKSDTEKFNNILPGVDVRVYDDYVLIISGQNTRSIYYSMDDATWKEATKMYFK